MAKGGQGKGKGQSGAAINDGLALSPGTATQLGQPLSLDYSIASNNPGNNAISRVSYQASQQGTLVAQDALNVSGDTGTVTFEKLGGAASAWTENGGTADVVAQLYFEESNPDKFDILAELDFVASGA